LGSASIQLVVLPALIEKLSLEPGMSCKSVTRVLELARVRGVRGRHSPTERVLPSS